MNAKVYDIITERILALLESGVCPWRRPWSRLRIRPQNFATERQYSGINHLLLCAIGYEVPLFLTFNQVSEQGGSVRKGSKGLPVVFWSMLEAEEKDEDGKPKRIPLLRYYTVFNAAQIEGIAFPQPQSRTGATFAPLETAENIARGWADGPRIIHGFRQAAYVPASDTIQMPSPASFDSVGDYYATLFHELGHATGAPRRLNRMSGKRPKDEAYAREELVAEMTAAFLCAHCGIDNDQLASQAAYLQFWINALKADKRLVIAAAGHAQKAANLIIGSPPEDAEPA